MMDIHLKQFFFSCFKTVNLCTGSIVLRERGYTGIEKKKEKEILRKPYLFMLICTKKLYLMILRYVCCKMK